MSGDYTPGKTIYVKFNTHKADGTPITLAGSGAVSVYKDGNNAESTAGVTLTIDRDGRTGYHVAAIDTSADGTFYAGGNDFDVVITTGTVDSISVVGTIVGGFSLNNRSALRPTTADRTLDVSAGGEAGVDLANVGSPTTTLNLSGTTIKTATDVEADTADIQSRLPAALTGDGNIKADTLRLGGTLQTGRDIGASVLLSSGTGTGQILLSSGTITAGTVSDKTGYSLSQSFPANFAALLINASGHLSRVTLADTVTTLTNAPSDSSGVTTLLSRVSGNVLLAANVPANFSALGINASGHVSRVTLVDTTTTNSDMRGTNNAFLAASAPTNFSSLAITGGGAVTAGTVSDKTGYSLSQSFPANFASLGINASGHILRTVLVDTTTTNSDMRGTDSAFLAASAPANFSSLGINASGHVSRVTLADTVTTLTNAPADSAGVTTLLSRVSGNVLLAANVPANFSSLAINASGHISRVTLVDTTTTNTDMRGTNNAFLAASAPANFSSLGINASGHVSRVTLTDTATTLTNAPSDSAGVTTLLTDWADGGRLDLILDDTNSLAGVAATAASNAFATLSTTVDSKLNSIAGYIDTEVSAIKTVTDKLDTAMSLDGSVYRFTANALELAPTGGGGGGASVEDIVDGITATYPDNFAALAINVSGHISRVTLVDTATTLTNAPSDSAGVATLLTRVTGPLLLASGYTAPDNSSIARILALSEGDEVFDTTVEPFVYTIYQRGTSTVLLSRRLLSISDVPVTSLSTFVAKAVE